MVRPAVEVIFCRTTPVITNDRKPKAVGSLVDDIVRSFTIMREPETLRELKAEILRQLEKSETVTITLTEGDGIHELLESITDGIKGAEELNRQSRKYGDPILCANNKVSHTAGRKPETL